jgi:hypothetical protein
VGLNWFRWLIPGVPVHGADGAVRKGVPGLFLDLDGKLQQFRLVGDLTSRSMLHHLRVENVGPAPPRGMGNFPVTGADALVDAFAEVDPFRCGVRGLTFDGV